MFVDMRMVRGLPNGLIAIYVCLRRGMMGFDFEIYDFMSLTK